MNVIIIMTDEKKLPCSCNKCSLFSPSVFVAPAYCVIKQILIEDASAKPPLGCPLRKVKYEDLEPLLIAGGYENWI